MPRRRGAQGAEEERRRILFRPILNLLISFSPCSFLSGWQPDWAMPEAFMSRRGLCGWVLVTLGASVACGGSVTPISSDGGAEVGHREPLDATPHTDVTTG